MQLPLLDLIESKLNEIIRNFPNKISSKHIGQTFTQIKVADLVRQGQQAKQIAHILGFSHKTVESHREKIREKFLLPCFGL